MHEKALDAILNDCVEYTRHNGPKDLIERHSKEVLAFALDAMALRLRLLRDALNAQVNGRATSEGEQR